MLEKINEKVEVIGVFKKMGDKLFPARIRWNGKDYKIEKLAYVHREKVGGTVHHLFHVSSNKFYFRLRFDTFNLSWNLEEVSDGISN